MTRAHLATCACAIASIAAASTSVRVPAPCDAESRQPAPHIRASTLRQGRFVYRETVAGKDTSTFTLEIRRRADGTWRFTGEGSGQRWESITDADFHPRSAMLSMSRHGRPYEFHLRYTGDSAFAVVTRVDSAEHAISDSSAALIRGPTIDQRIDWASLMASDLGEGNSAAYEVYDPATGSSRLTASASSGPTIASPDGPHATIKLDYTICKAGKSESYTVFATKGRERTMLREDLRGDIVAELVRVEP
ncbi:MAG TPA: hypothetical protein VGO46_12740 [Gemmatimonadaceae bacterium]|jgi:hypothetical protein|nr:hypothetical protein [Gemmatimonadaceae bacterium]